MAAAKKDGVWQFIDRQGRSPFSLKLLPTGVLHLYDGGDIDLGLPAFSEGLAFVRTPQKSGFINQRGEFVIVPQVEQSLTLFTEAPQFSEGLAWLEAKGGVKQAIDKTQKVVIEGEYNAVAAFHEGLAAVKVLGKLEGRDHYLWGYIDRSGREVIARQYTNIGSGSEGLLPVELDGKWGLIDRTGKLVVKNIYEEISEPVQARARFKQGKFWGIVDVVTGQVVAPARFAQISLSKPAAAPSTRK